MSLRLITLAAVLLTGTSAAAQPWQIHESTSALDGKHQVSAFLVGANPVLDSAGAPTPVVLMLGCGPKHSVDLTFSWPSYLGVSNETALLEWRTNRAPVQRTKGIIMSAGQFLNVYGRNAAKMLEAMEDDGELVVRITGYNTADETVFKLADVGRAKELVGQACAAG